MTRNVGVYMRLLVLGALCVYTCAQHTLYSITHDPYNATHQHLHRRTYIQETNLLNMNQTLGLQVPLAADPLDERTVHSEVFDPRSKIWYLFDYNMSLWSYSFQTLNFSLVTPKTGLVKYDYEYVGIHGDGKELIFVNVSNALDFYYSVIKLSVVSGPAQTVDQGACENTGYDLFRYERTGFVNIQNTLYAIIVDKFYAWLKYDIDTKACSVLELGNSWNYSISHILDLKLDPARNRLVGFIQDQSNYTSFVQFDVNSPAIKIISKLPPVNKEPYTKVFGSAIGPDLNTLWVKFQLGPWHARRRSYHYVTMDLVTGQILTSAIAHKSKAPGGTWDYDVGVKIGDFDVLL